jgi:hypothetical protein
MMSEIVNDRFCPPVIACFQDLESKSFNNLVLISSIRAREGFNRFAERGLETSATFLVADRFEKFG